MILGGLTVACPNIAIVDMTMAVGDRKTQPSFLFATFFKAILGPWGFKCLVCSS